MWKASVGIPVQPKVAQDDDWETDPDFVNNVTEEEQRWGSKTIEGSGRTAGAIDMAKLREETTKANDIAKEKQKAEQPNASYGYGGKFGVEKDRMDSSAVGHDYIGKVAKHVSQTDYSTGFGGKFGVQTDRVDKSAVSWNHKEMIEKHGSQKDYSAGFGGKFGVERDRQDKSAVGWDYNEKPQKHNSQAATKTNALGEKSQKPSDLRAKFESLAQSKEEPLKPLGKPKLITQRWPPVTHSTSDSTNVAKTQASMPSTAQEPTPSPTIKEYAPTESRTSDLQTPVNSSKTQESDQQTVVPAPAAFHSNRQSSSEEWETDSNEITPEVSKITPAFVKQPNEPPVLQSSITKEKERRREPELDEAKIVVDEELVERVMREEMALREQLVQEMNEETYDEEEESTYSAIALYDYQAAADDEISFDPDEIITNIEMIDEGWWRGTCRGNTGLFPANYVQLQE